MKRVGILYHPKIAAARAFAEELAGFLPSLNAVVWLCSAWDEEGAKAQVGNTELILSIGGDGTILRAARAVAPQSIPIVGINLGRLGFMTELSVDETRDRLVELLMQNHELSIKGPDLFIISLGSTAKTTAFQWLCKLNLESIRTEMDFGDRSLKSLMKRANKLNAKYVLIVGDSEIKNKEATLRNMSTKEQITVPFDNIVNKLKENIK